MARAGTRSRGNKMSKQFILECEKIAHAGTRSRGKENVKAVYFRVQINNATEAQTY